MTQMPGYPCEICKRSGGAVSINSYGSFLQFCSHECAKAWIMRGEHLKPNEANAALAGGAAAGAYLDSIGKTDLATMTEAEWRTFCGELFRAACEDLRKQADDEIPF